MEPLGRWGSILGDFGAPGRPQEGFTLKAGNWKVDFLAKMVAPRVDLGPQLAATGGPKSHFGPKSRHKIAKKSFREGVQKKIENSIEKSLKN